MMITMSEFPLGTHGKSLFVRARKPSNQHVRVLQFRHFKSPIIYDKIYDFFIATVYKSNDNSYTNNDNNNNNNNNKDKSKINIA